MREDRIAFGDLIRRLDGIYRKQGTRIELIEWEDLDISYNNCRKQDEYNDSIRQSDVFVALFHTLAGKYTREEFEVAREENIKRQIPKILIHCRDLQPGEIESKELTEFKERLNNELGHFWGHYNSNDKLHLDFVMWLQRSELVDRDSLKVENNEVTIDGVTIARMSQLPFVADNSRYKEKTAMLESLSHEVEQLRQAIAQMPNMTYLQDMLQQKLNELNALKEEIEKFQVALLDTAKRIADMQLEKVSGTLARAIDAFEKGDLDGANALLNEIAHYAERHIERLEQERALVHQDIEAFRLQAKTVIADTNIPIELRIDQVENIYAKADDWAQRSAYDKKKHDYLLREYGGFLDRYAKYDKVIGIYNREIALSEELYGNEHTNTSASYNNIGAVYDSLGNYPKALEYFGKALEIYERFLSEEHPDVAVSYNNIGAVYDSLGDYQKALEYYRKSLAISKKVLGEEHLYTSASYNNIGAVYDSLGDYPKALEYFGKALEIRKKVLGEEHPDTAASYNNIGAVYNRLGDFPNALEYHGKSLAIEKRVHGEEHPSTATSYNNIGLVYGKLGDYPKALEYFSKALEIRKKVLGEEHLFTSASYNNIGDVYDCIGDFPKALEYYGKALEIKKRVHGEKHPSIAIIYNNIGQVYGKLGDYLKALECFQKSQQ